MTAETITYDRTGGQPKNRTVTTPWSTQTASRSREAENGTAISALVAHRVGVKETDAIQTKGSSWRGVRTHTTVENTYGLPTKVETAVITPNGTGETLSERKCATTEYVHNTTAWLIGLPKQTRSTTTSCDNEPTADPATQLVESEQTRYDGQTHGASPTRGLATQVDEINGLGTAHSVSTKTTYDPLGRVRTVEQPGSGTTETQYTPGDAGGPITSIKIINPKGHTTVTTLDPGRNLPLTVTDSNNRVTRSEYDGLGRLVKGWSPSRSSGTQTPDVTFGYQAATVTDSKATPAAVTTNTLKDDGTYGRQVALFDGLGRPAQTQADAHGAGRIITETHYNDHGLAEEQRSGYLAKGAPEPQIFEAKSTTQIPRRTIARYDGMERQTRLSTYHGAAYKYATFTSYGDDSTTVDGPGTSTPTVTSVTDVHGRVTSVTHYTKPDKTSSRTINYAYDARGNRTQVTDPAGSTWSYEYDTRGRLTKTTDPDTGDTTTQYDEADRPVKVTSALEKSVSTDYDVLGRVTEIREGTTPVKRLTYDTLPGALGKPVATTRITPTGSYINRVTGYDTDYRPTGRETVVPDHAMTKGLAGTYAYAYSYTETGKPESVTLPAKGGLAREKVITRYNEDGLPESTSGLDWYVADATYSPYGEVMRTVSGTQPFRVWTTNFTDRHSGSLQRTVVDRETADEHNISDSRYSYDAAGLITSSARELTTSTGKTLDNQCFTYDALSQLVNAWTSNITPGENGTGCTSSGGAVWGYQKNAAFSSGPVADAADAKADTTTPDASLTSSLAATAPSAGTVATGTSAYHQSYTLDWLGNRATLTEHSPGNTAARATYTYGHGTPAGNGTTPTAIGQPHTLTSVTSTPAGKESDYTYDLTGNTTTRNFPGTNQDQTLTWTATNKLDTITENGVKTTYVYDAEGNRILENSPSGSTLYLGETEITATATGSITRASRTYSQPGAPPVVRTTENGATTGHVLSALIADHLGTANTAIELHSGQTVTRRAYKPYGEIRGTKPAEWPNKRSYLGVGIDDEATGLTHIGAREYDQSTGRFISADPLIDITDPLQMNGYAYSDNNPVSKSDPTGLMRADHGSSGNIKSGDVLRTLYQMNRSWGMRSHDAMRAAWDSWRAWQARKQVRKTYVTILPGLQVAADTPGVKKYANFIKKDAKKRNLWYNGPDPSLPTYQSDLAGLQMRACHETKVCPGGKAKLFQKFFAEKVMIGIGSGRGRGPSRPGNPCASNSFIPGTKVLMADGTRKPIEKVRVGEKVLATDPKTGETDAKTVTAEIVGTGSKSLVKITIDIDGTNGQRVASVTATDGHPFWVPELDEWVEAADLHSGQWLTTSAGTRVLIKSIKRWTERAAVYNLTVADLNTYYVLAGTTPVLVHNCGTGAVSDRVMDKHILPRHDANHADSWKWAEKSKFEDWVTPGHIRNWSKLAMRKPMDNMNLGTGSAHRHILDIRSRHPIGYDADGNDLFSVAVWVRNGAVESVHPN